MFLKNDLNNLGFTELSQEEKVNTKGGFIIVGSIVGFSIALIGNMGKWFKWW